MESAMRRVLPLLAAMLALAFAPAPFPKRQAADAGAADLKTMQGAWVLVCELKNGRREEMTRECVWLIEGDRIRAFLDGKEGSTSFIKLDGRSKPRSIDLRTQRDQASHLPADTCWRATCLKSASAIPMISGNFGLATYLAPASLEASGCSSARSAERIPLSARRGVACRGRLRASCGCR
jgi:uncharacterized protein (TIGR03067 family)